MFTLTTFNGSLWVLGSRWSWSRLVLVGTELLFLFGSLQFLLVVRLLLNVQLLLDLMRSTASIRRQTNINQTCEDDTKFYLHKQQYCSNVKKINFLFYYFYQVGFDDHKI